MTLDPLQPPPKFPLDPNVPPGTVAEAAPAETSTTEPQGLRPVKTSEVIACGKKTCRSCFGAGFVNVIHVVGTQALPRVCGCAMNRFLKQNASAITYHQESGSWFWTK